MKNVSRRLQAAVMSAVLAAAAVPAGMIMTASAVVSAPAAVSSMKLATNEKWSKGKKTKVDIPTTYTEKNPLENIVITIESDYATSFSYGFGITTNDGWTEHTEDDTWTTEKNGGSGYSVDLNKGTNTIVIDVSSLDIQYGKYGNFEFRCYYCAHWDNKEGDMVENTVTFKGITYNDSEAQNPTKDPDDPDTPDEPEEKENVIPNNNKHSNGENSESGKNWVFIDNGDGTATISSTVAKQIDGEALGNVVLTKGYDEDYYAAHPSDDPDRPMNSHKFRFADFGVTGMDGVVIESITYTIESDVEMDQVVYGGGINVKSGSPADTEYAKQIAGIKGKEQAGYWYNDMGLEGEGSVSSFEEQGVEFGITPGNGGKVYGAGSYYNVYWEVPAEVQPYVSDSSTDSLSIQYWWGNDVDGEEVESIRVTNAVLTYTKTVTIPYDGSVSSVVKGVLDHTGSDSKKNLEIPYEDLGVDETMDVYAIKFGISASAPIGKLIYNVGTGVEETVNPDYWFQESGNYAVLDAGDSIDIMWIVPKAVAGDENHPNGINTKDGSLLIGYYYGETDAITIDDIEIYYAAAPTTTTTTTTTKATTTTTTTTEATTTTTKATTTTTTTKATTTTTTTKPTTTTTTTTTTTEATTTTTEATTTEEPAKILWGDANCDGLVNISDATAIVQSIANNDKYGLTEQGAKNADVFENGSGVTPMDAYVLQLVESGSIKVESLPVDSINR